MKLKIYFYFLALALFVSCGDDDPSCINRTIAEEAADIDAFIAANGLTMQTTGSGLRFNIDTPGAGLPVQLGDTVELEFTGTRLDGTIFDQGEIGPFLFQSGSFIAGFEEALTLLNQGATGSFIIPSSLAFGCNAPANGSVGPNEILFVTITITRINCEPTPLNDELTIIDGYASSNGFTVQSTASELLYEITTAGTGDNIMYGDVITVDFRGTLLDDRVFDEGQLGPLTLDMGSFIPGFEEGLLLLNEGAEATLFLPSSLAYGCSPPPGTIIDINEILIFEVTVVQVN